MNSQYREAILLFSCNDQKGLVFKLTDQIFKLGGNITDLNEHVDVAEEKFFIRIAFGYDSAIISQDKLAASFEKIAEDFRASWKLNFRDEKQKVAIFVSKHEHCLQEILWRNTLNEFNIDVVSIISNHKDLEYLAEQYNLPFYYFEITKDSKLEVEKKQIELLINLNVDTIVLARYMQILSREFVDKYPNKIINIHHSFLPAFAGGNPYKQAYQRGVKIIGATSHYVTEKLDEGPIIEQDIIRISHSDSLKNLVTKGRDLERLVISRALLLHSQYRILVDGKKTVVFL